MNIRRLVIGDHNPLCRADLASLLAGRLEINEVVHASDFPHTLAAIARASHTTIVAVSMKLPSMNGVAGLGKLRVDHPSLLLVVTAGSPEREVVLRSLSAGVHGYIPIATPPDEVVRAFQTILSGQIYVPPLVSEGTVESCITPMDTPKIRIVLTDRQLEVLQLLAAGQSNRQIGRSLSISHGTVKVHLTAVYRALGVHNRTSAAAALRMLAT